jgi:HSP20 family molecular chaperone IbpA
MLIHTVKRLEVRTMKKNTSLVRRHTAPAARNTGWRNSFFGNIMDDFLNFEPFPAVTFPRISMPDFGFSSRSEFLPDVEIEEEKNKFVVKTDMPGLKQGDIRVKVHNNVLSITGERKEKKDEKNAKKNYSVHEESYRNFESRIRLPEKAAAGKVMTHYRNGELTIEVPKAH